ncbi:hypothetical protein [Poseidonibacter ostreae]|uniref:DNA-binding protein n=1 Tax=Poseidonibacter ostreae TaxID=2654171 RepID=A0A6L4WU50_9BACT|nr:hypothetical protein [Poseidonibacter ostreae]KAB7889582.1 hypothetical protein GBG19_05865 [Poseidonibacter ostreae]
MSNKDLMFNALYNKYNKLVLTRKELCDEMSISIATLNRRIKAQEALPKYFLDGGKYLFLISALCDFLIAMQNI